jgi:aromatic-L-amino-acid decarboxylase
VLRRTFSLTPAYLETQEQDVALSFSDYSFQLGRRFRALKLWWVLRAFGREGLVARLRQHCEFTSRLASEIEATAEWEVMAPVGMSVVCFRHRPPGLTDTAVLERHNAAILDRVNGSGRVFLSHTKLGSDYVLRMAIGNLRTEWRHVAEAWRLLQDAAHGP